MAKIICIANQKGGVGKTTTSINLSSCIAVAEKKVLLIDIDPQANTSSGLGLEVNEDTKSIYEVLINDLDPNDVIQKTKVPNLDIIPSHIKLVGAEVELVHMIAREKKLFQAISKITEKYDFVFIDCPPSLSLLTLNAFAAANSVLIPIQCEYYALEGLSQLLNTINLVKKNLNPDLSIEGVLLTMFDSRLNLCQQIADEIRDYFKEKVYKSVINRNVRIAEAPSFGKPIIMYDIVSLGAKNYMSLAEEVIEQN
jgi:chromosome partitioning protein